MTQLRLEPFGDSGWRFRLPRGANGGAVLDALRALPGVHDAIVAEELALVAFDPAAPPAGLGRAVERVIAAGTPSATREQANDSSRVHVVRARYDGPDLDEMAARAGLSVREVIALHTGATYVVAAVGFLPGFAYLRGLDARLVAPRRPSPRARVPVLSIGVAGPYTGVYPFPSPGGWNLVGTAVGFTPFDEHTGAALRLGDVVRFETAAP
jgi:5-oxoprolinase (ATP-hydrolysing) subunit A